MLVLLVLMLPISTEVFTFLAFRDMGTRKKGQQQVKTNKTEILLDVKFQMSYIYLYYN